jgi:hypothetical protein
MFLEIKNLARTPKKQTKKRQFCQKKKEKKDFVSCGK